MSASDLFARVPPETGHIDELTILVEECGQCVRIAASLMACQGRRASGRLKNRIQCLQSQASARARRNALSRALRVSVAAAVNSERASASRPARNRKSPLAAGNGA